MLRSVKEFISQFKFKRLDLPGYMHRWIFFSPFGELRIHHILRSDSDRDLHDHPFDFTSILLTGSYVEVLSVDTNQSTCGAIYQGQYGNLHFWKWPRFSKITRKAADSHRLILEKPVWTLVFASKRYKEWGFHTPEGWIHHSDYFRQMKERGEDVY